MSQSDFQEIEYKFLDVDPAELGKKILAIGGQRQFRRLFKRYVFDYPDLRLHKEKAWLRVRDEGDKVTMTYKQRQGVVEGQSDEGMREVEVEVSSFEHAAEILRSIGLIEKFYEENWRTLYTLGDVEFMIDELPMIPPYIEVESGSKEKIEEAAKKLGLDLTQARMCSAMQVYKHYGINQMDYRVITFDRQEKRKQ